MIYMLRLQNVYTIDTQYNNLIPDLTQLWELSVKLISTEWLPVLSGKKSPHLRLYNSLIREWIKCNSDNMLLIYINTNTASDQKTYPYINLRQIWRKCEIEWWTIPKKLKTN